MYKVTIAVAGAERQRIHIYVSSLSMVYCRCLGRHEPFCIPKKKQKETCIYVNIYMCIYVHT